MMSHLPKKYDLILYSQFQPQWWKELAIYLTGQGWVVKSSSDLLKDEDHILQHLHYNELFGAPILLTCSDEAISVPANFTGLIYKVPCEQSELKLPSQQHLQRFISHLLISQANDLYINDPRVQRSLDTAFDAINLILQSYEYEDLDPQGALSHVCDVIASVMTLGEQLMQTQAYSALEQLYSGLLNRLTQQVTHSMKVRNPSHYCWQKLRTHLEQSPQCSSHDQDITHQETNVYLLTDHLEQILIARDVARIKIELEIQVRAILAEEYAYTYDFLNLINYIEQWVEPFYQMGNLRACLSLYRHCTHVICEHLFHWLQKLDHHYLDYLEPLLYVDPQSKQIHEQVLSYQEQYALLLQRLQQTKVHEV